MSEIDEKRMKHAETILLAVKDSGVDINNTIVEMFIPDIYYKNFESLVPVQISFFR